MVTEVVVLLDWLGDVVVARVVVVVEDVLLLDPPLRGAHVAPNADAFLNLSVALPLVTLKVVSLGEVT